MYTMANKLHLALIKQGRGPWNEWRRREVSRGIIGILPDLIEAELNAFNLVGTNLRDADLTRANLKGSTLMDTPLIGANLTGADLSQANMRRANLRRTILNGANLTGADLRAANLRGANLSNTCLNSANLSDARLSATNLTGARLTMANLRRANLRRADLTGADLRNADLRQADLGWSNFSEANLNGAVLNSARLVNTNLQRANLEGCSVYGISAWGLNLDQANQSNLIITPPKLSRITVDNLEIAQFIYLLTHNAKIRHIIDTITSKVVLILGRFTSERKVVLDAIRDELRQHDYVPVLFDFEGPDNRDLTETISTLAHMSRFIIADITEPRSIPQELQAIIPHLISVPVQPLLNRDSHEYGMFEHFKHYPQVLPVYHYDEGDLEDLLASLKGKVITPIEAKIEELKGKTGNFGG